jgi:hypothetical protein
MRAGDHSWWVAVLAGLLPVIAANAAFLINIDAGLEACIPYWEGCMSVSRGVRSGPGLILFKLMALPAAIAMIMCWLQVGRWLDRVSDHATDRTRAIVWMGVVGAAFSLVYAAWLGTEGDIYRWLRRYGVVFYFGLTGLAQLFLVSVLWKQRQSILMGKVRGAVTGFCTIAVLAWVLGVASAFKRKLIDDPAFLDRVENALEWNFALVLSLAFVALGLVFRAEKSAPRVRA